MVLEVTPAGQAELLRLLLDVLVVERGTLLAAHLTGADLDADLLQGRTLDRRHELQCRARLAGVEVGLGVLGDLRDVGRQLARLGEVRTLRRLPLGVGVTARLGGREGDELLGGIQLVALALTWGCTVAEVPGQTVMPFVAASGPGSGEEADVVRLARSDVLDVGRSSRRAAGTAPPCRWRPPSRRR